MGQNVKRTPSNTLVVFGAVALLALTGCANGGSTASGTYHGTTGKRSTASIMTVDGDTVTWSNVSCESPDLIDIEDSDTSIGTLDKTRTTVAWTQNGRFSSTDPFTESEDGSVITMSGGTYSRVGTEVGDSLLTEREQRCKEEIERQEQKAANQAKAEAEDAKIRPAIEKTIETLLGDREILDKAWVTNDWSEVNSIIAENGLTEEEFLGYTYRNYNIHELYELNDWILGDPEGLREMMSQ